MKKIILLIAFVITSIGTNAQSFFDTLEDMDGVDVVVITKDAFEMISKFKDVKIDDNEGMKVFQMIQDLKEFKMFSSENLSVANSMETMVNRAIKKQNLAEFMRVKKDNSRVKIYIKAGKNKDYVSEVLMFIKGVNKQTKGMSEAIIVSLTGNIDINRMSELAETFSKNSTVKVKSN